MEMCPMIKHSCGTIKDQVKAYDRWVKNGEKDTLMNRTSYYMGIYEKLLDNFQEAYSKAVNLQKKLENEEMGNCKIIVTRIS